MGAVNKAIQAFGRKEIHELENGGQIEVLGHIITEEDVQIQRDAVADVVVMSEGHLTVALDIELDAELLDEGRMREALSQLQRLRKAKGLEVTDRIKLKLFTNSSLLKRALDHHQIYLVSELLADEFSIEESPSAPKDAEELMVDEESLWVKI